MITDFVNWIMRKLLPLLLAFAATTINLNAAVFYVATTGNSSANGSIAFPWDLITALNQPSGVLPGDTIYLRGGVYSGNFISNLNGSNGSYIRVIQYPGERATISDTRQYAGGATLQINGSWTSYEEFEVTNSSAIRTSTSSSSFRPMGLQIQAPHTRILHLIIHDTGHGIGFWKEASDSEIYGCIIYNCGTQNSPGNYNTHGHGIYTQNNTGVKTIEDNVIFNQFGFGLHLYPNPGNVQGYRINGNTLFHNGILTGAQVRMNNILVETYPPYPSDDIVIQSNRTYEDYTNIAHTSLYDTDVLTGGVTGSYGNILIDSNCFAGNSRAGFIALNWDTAIFTHNFMYCRTETAGAILPVSASPADYTWNFNSYYGLNAAAQFVFQNNPATNFNSWQSLSGFDASGTYTNNSPNGYSVYQEPDRYTAGRSLITFYNWDSLATVSFTPYGLNNGDAFEILDVQNIFGAPVFTGTFDSLNPAISIPTSYSSVATPLGWNAPPHTSQVFNCYILRKTEPTSVGEVRVKPFEVYPNPVIDFVSFRLPQPTSTITGSVIRDLSGAIVKCNMEFREDASGINIQVSDLPSGMYFLELQTEHGNYRSRFVKI